MQLTDELRDFLADASFALLCVELDLGAGEPELVILLKSSGDILAELKEVRAEARVGWMAEETQWGPVVCLVFHCEAQGAGDLMGEIYFDVSDRDDRAMLRTLACQTRLKAAMFDEEMELAYLADVARTETDRLFAEQALDRAEALLETAEQLDFDLARDRFQERFGLEELLDAVPGLNRGQA